jgi:hypothetical protein
MAGLLLPFVLSNLPKFLTKEYFVAILAGSRERFINPYQEGAMD